MKETADQISLVPPFIPLAPAYFGRPQRLEEAAGYFPPAGRWQRKPPAELGLDPGRLQQAIDYAQANASTWDFERDQVHTFGSPLGPLPERRAASNGILLRHGFIAAEFGDTKANDPVYSVAKSFLSTICGVAVDRGLIQDVNDPVARYVRDGGYASAHNARITWKNHLQQTSEWVGALWGKNADLVGEEHFGKDHRREARTVQQPGSFYEYNDVRINRLSLSLLRLFGEPLPHVLKDSIMDPIGASPEWRWLPYANSHVKIGGQWIGSVSGGTRWGGGLWINSEDLARFGLLILNQGGWRDRQLVSRAWVKDAVKPAEQGRDYGYLWRLNTRGRQWPSAPRCSFAAIGKGANIIWIDPDHDLVLVWRWCEERAIDGMIQRILSAVIPGESRKPLLSHAMGEKLYEVLT